MKNRKTLLLLLAAVAWIVTPADCQEDVSVYEKTLEQKAPLVANVRMVLEVNMEFGDGFGGGRGGSGRMNDREQTVRTKGVVIDPSGLIMVAGVGMDSVSDQVRTEILDVKVMFADDDEEYDGLVVVTDSNLNLTYIIIKDLGDKKLSAVDFAAAKDAAIGQELIGVSRHEAGFDYAPFVDTLRITGRIELPRPCWSVSGAFRERGLPLFDAQGHVVGVQTTQQGADASAGNSRAAGGRRGRGGFGFMDRGRTGGSLFLVPAADVRANLPKVMELAQQVLDKAASEGEGGSDEEVK